MRQLAASFVAAVTIAATAPAAMAVGFLEVDPEPVVDVRTFDGEFQVVGQFRLTPLSWTGDQLVDVKGLGFVEIQQTDLASVLEVGIAWDTDFDGHYNPDVDEFAVPPTGDLRNDVIWIDEDGNRIIGGAEGYDIRFYACDGAPQAGGHGTGSPSSSEPYAHWGFRSQSQIRLAINNTYRMFILYRVHPDTPLDTRFQPELRDHTSSGVVWGWWTVNPDDPTDFDGQPLALATPESGTFRLRRKIVDVDRMVTIARSGEETPITQSDLEELALYVTLVTLPEFDLELILFRNDQPDGMTVVPGATDAVLGRLALSGISATGRVFELTRLSVRMLAGDPADVLALRLYLDDGNGALDAGDVLLDESSRQPLEAGEVTFTLPAGMVSLAHNESARLLIAGDFDASVRVNMRYRLLVSGGTVVNGSAGGLPVGTSGATGTVERQPRLQMAFEGVAEQHAAAGAENVVAAVLRIDAIDTTAVLQTIRLRVLGSAADAAMAFTAVRLVADLNGNRQLDPNDRVLAGSAFGPDGSVRLQPGLAEVGHGGRMRLLLVVTVAEEDPARSFSFRFAVDAIETATDVPVIGADAESGVLVIGAEDADPEFDPAPLGPFTVFASGAGCSTGTLSPVQVAVWLMGLAALGIVRRHRAAA